MPRWHLSKCIAFVVMALVAVAAVTVAQSSASKKNVRRPVFVPGLAKGVDSIRTPWANRTLHWAVLTQAGVLAKGEGRTDATGLIGPRFDVPDVRVAVNLALKLAPQDALQKEITLPVVVLPKDPFADRRETFKKLDVGLLSDGALAEVAKRRGLKFSKLSHDLPREPFKGKVVILSGLLGDDFKATWSWIESLPAGTCLIVANDSTGSKSPFAKMSYLSMQKPARKARLFIDRDAVVWTDLNPQWLDMDLCPPRKLTAPKGLVAMRVFAAQLADDGGVYPYVMETTDAGGRCWLIWNLPNTPHGSDPRWDLILRNSLLWAYRKILSQDKEEKTP